MTWPSGVATTTLPLATAGEEGTGAAASRRRQLTLARADLVRKLEAATGAYEEMLRRSLAALDEELARVG